MNIFNVIGNLYYSIFGEYKDYYNFLFDVNKPLPPGYLKVMEKCCQLLDNLGIKYTLATGTALGIYRDGKIISHDNDIDIDIVGFTDYEIINKAFIKSSMRLGRKLLYRNKIQQLIYYSNNMVIFDICFWEKKGEFVYNYIEKGYVRKLPYVYYKNPNKIKFHNRNYYIPYPTDQWLESQYGVDWRMPKKYKGNWMQENVNLSHKK